MSYFEKVKGMLGFGCMRLPMNGDKVDYEQFCRMTDTFIENGFNYFDTAHMYIDGKSETAIRDCVVKRHPRESFVLTNKLSGPYFNSQEEIRPFFEKQLELCGVEYFDFYLMHSQYDELFEKYKKCRAYETAFELKKEGKIKHVGISFHDRAEVLDKILTEYPDIEVVQIQFNYLDYDDINIQSKKCYDVCRKHNKPIMVMEPVKGGKLANMPKEAQDIFDSVGNGSYAGYAIRFAAGFDGMFMILSGMSNMEQLEDNIQLVKNFEPLNSDEQQAVAKVTEILKKQQIIPCTECRYCTEGCPANIAIPDIFSAYNELTARNEKANDMYISAIQAGGKASDCIQCGKCEEICPQKLEIRHLLKKCKYNFE